MFAKECTRCGRLYPSAMAACDKCGTEGFIACCTQVPAEVGKASDAQVGGAHYKHMAIQPTEFIQKNKLNFCEGNIIKYACRHQFKNGREDVEKIIHYAQLLLELEYEDT